MGSNVRGTRSGTSTINVNGSNVATTNYTSSGYQPTNNGTYSRAEVADTAPPGTVTLDLYELVKVISNGAAFSLDDPIQSTPRAAETLTYDADGNLLGDARWTLTPPQALRLRATLSLAVCLSQSAAGFPLTWDAADRKCAEFY